MRVDNYNGKVQKFAIATAHERKAKGKILMRIIFMPISGMCALGGGGDDC